MNDFTTVFLFTEYFKSLNITAFLILFLVVLVLGLLLFRSSKGLLYSTPRDAYSFRSETNLILGIMFALIIVTIILFFLLGPLIKQRACAPLQAKYDTQQYKITEGVVHVLHFQPSSGHDDGDIVKIGNVELEVDFFVESCGYTTTLSHGGVLAEGTYAKVFYDYEATQSEPFQYTILRIDIRK